MKRKAQSVIGYILLVTGVIIVTLIFAQGPFKDAVQKGIRSIPCMISGSHPCGDVNYDCIVNNDDSQYLIDFMFAGGETPTDTDLVDANGDGVINMSDIMYINNYVNNDGPAPICGTAP